MGTSEDSGEVSLLPAEGILKSLRPEAVEIALMRGRFEGLIARFGIAPEGIRVVEEAERRNGKLDPPGVVTAGEERARLRPLLRVLLERRLNSAAVVDW